VPGFDGRLPTAQAIGGDANLDYRTPILQALPMLVGYNDGTMVQAADTEFVHNWLRGAFKGVDGITERNADYQIYAWLGTLHGNQLRYVALGVTLVSALLMVSRIRRQADARLVAAIPSSRCAWPASAARKESGSHGQLRDPRR
jgi:hypothetical protein